MVFGDFYFFYFSVVTRLPDNHFSTIFENVVLVDFSDFGWLDMFHIAYYDSTNCSRPLDNQWLPELRAELCKMRPILQKKGENLDFTLFFEFECLNMLDITDYDSTNGSGLLCNR